MRPTTSLILRCLNEAAHLPRLFAGLDAQSVRVDQLVLVDSGSSDDSVALSRAWGADVVHISPADFTYGRALNVGADAAWGDILVLLSAHTYPVDHFWLERLSEPFQRPGVGLVYGRQVGDDRTAHSEHQLLEQWFPRRSEPRQTVPFAHNANAAVRRDVWARHPFDEEMSALEDVEMAVWVLDHGLDISYVAEAAITHVHEETWRQRYRRYRREARALRMLLPEVALPTGDLAGWLVNSVRGDLSALRRGGRQIASARDILAFRTAQYLGAYRGFRSVPTGVVGWPVAGDLEEKLQVSWDHVALLDRLYGTRTHQSQEVGCTT